MPERVVTVDVEALLGQGIVLLASQLRPYDPAGLPRPWQTGHYLDCLVRVPAGIPDASAGVTSAWEYTDDVPARSKESGAGHIYLGHPRFATQPIPAPTEERIATVTIDIGGRSGWLFTGERDDVAKLGGGLAIEAYVDTRGGGSSNATRAQDRIYDAIEDHPPGLAVALQRTGTNRRQRASDTPTDWNARRRGAA